MKRITYNKIIFVCISLLVVAAFSLEMAVEGFHAGRDFFQHKNVNTLIDDIDNSSKEIRYKDFLIDLQSLTYQLTDMRKVKKEDETLLRTDSDYLCFCPDKISDELLLDAADACSRLKAQTDAMGIPLLYVFAPTKAYWYEEYNPIHHADCDRFLALLSERDVPVLQLAEKMQAQGKTIEDSYFKTDHHWLPETGFWAFSEICKELNSRYGFQYDTTLTDPANYKTTVYEEWFLGSQGKKVGRFFSPIGVDDISLIAPNFETRLSVTNRDTRVGTFEEALFARECIDTKKLGRSPHTLVRCGFRGSFPQNDRHKTP